MSSAGFPINDLLRRRLQTSLTVATLAFSVASTMFLLLFSSQLSSLTSATNVFTVGINVVFSQFISFIGILIFAVGAILTSFIAFSMMAQRTRDFGLIKAAGCPNNLVAGYFMTELLATTVVGCGLGLILGFIMDYGISNYVFSEYRVPNLWSGPIVFVVFLVLALVFGIWPLLKASRMSPIKALSPVTYHGLAKTGKHKPLSKSGLTWSIASRSLLRRQSATFRLLILLSIVFILLTVCVGGGVIASDTTTSWVQNSVGKNSIVIASPGMGTQYEQLLSKFSGALNTSGFDYSSPNLAISNSVVTQLNSLSSVDLVDTRLVLDGQIQEVANFSFNGDTGSVGYVGGNRTTTAMVVGVDPAELSSNWNVQGRFLNTGDQYQAVIGDSVSQTIYMPDSSLGISQANPLVEDMLFENTQYNIVGVCVDPINNGFITYVPIQTLENASGILDPNLLLVTLKSSADQSVAIVQIKSLLKNIDPNLNVFQINSVVEKDTSFLGSNWETIMIMPFFTLAAAALCMVSYMMLMIDEQHQEFGVLRSIGAKPRFVVLVLGVQSAVLLLSSFGIGISLGTMLTYLFLLPQPVVTGFTIFEIAGLLFAALAGILLCSLYPAFKVARSSILKIMS
ncbi:MAG: ABC transporter permease [Candidatus Bathyarchaeia archaeon]